MAMGKKRARQPDLWIATDELPHSRRLFGDQLFAQQSDWRVSSVNSGFRSGRDRLFCLSGQLSIGNASGRVQSECIAL